MAVLRAALMNTGDKRDNSLNFEVDMEAAVTGNGRAAE